MNPLLKKQFLLEAWNYNQSLEKPYLVGYKTPTEYYNRNKYVLFQPNLEKPVNVIIKKEYYDNVIEHDIQEEMKNSNIKKLVLSAGDTFLIPYFKYFFIHHPEKQSDLLKFFNDLLSYKHDPFQFLKDFDKKDVEKLLLNIDKWSQYSTNNIQKLEDLMQTQGMNEGFRVSILKKYVERSLKVINKQPLLSQELETFLNQYYPQALDIIAPNVVAIQNRKQEVDLERYFTAFNQTPLYCLVENINIDILLKTFQVSGWTHSAYLSAIQNYHEYLKNKYGFEITVRSSTNQKEMDVFIKMRTSEYDMEQYKGDLMVLFKFYRNNHEQKMTQDNLMSIFLNHQLQQELPQETKKARAKKI